MGSAAILRCGIGRNTRHTPGLHTQKHKIATGESRVLMWCDISHMSMHIYRKKLHRLKGNQDETTSSVHLSLISDFYYCSNSPDIGCME